MAQTRPGGVVAAFPFRVLAAPLTSRQRATLETQLRLLLAWQRSLRAWPNLAWGADATPFVSVYAGGTLRGCFGSHEGPPRERLGRAFLRALEDSRFGGVAPAEREILCVQLSYPFAVRRLDARRAAEELEPGTEGVAVVRPERAPTVLLPQVARDGCLAASELLSALARKAGVTADALAESELYAFQTDDVVARSGRALASHANAADPALVWLSRLVDSDGAVCFAIDPRARRTTRGGPMLHGRAAVAVRALAAGGRHARHVARARGWLAERIARGLRGVATEHWPDTPARIAGTLALAAMAGVDVERTLRTYVSSADAIATAPWHAAQVVAVLGRDAPDALWKACVRDLDARPWAPWTLLAARARGDADVIARCERAIVESLRNRAPHRGGANVTRVPEIALTAVAIEALEATRSSTARNAAQRAREFLTRWQFVAGNVPAGLDARMAAGAYPASPVSSVLRCDITGHAVLALGTAVSR